MFPVIGFVRSRSSTVVGGLYFVVSLGRYSKRNSLGFPARRLSGMGGVGTRFGLIL